MSISGGRRFQWVCELCGKDRRGKGEAAQREFLRSFQPGHAFLPEPVSGGAESHRTCVAVRVGQGRDAADSRTHARLVGPGRYRSGEARRVRTRIDCAEEAREADEYECSGRQRSAEVSTEASRGGARTFPGFADGRQSELSAED